MGRRADTSWLCPDGADRERLLDMEGRIRPVRTASMVILAVALLATAPSIGWWTLAPLVLSTAAFWLMDRGLEDAASPEYRLAGAWVLAEFAIAGSVALTGGPHSPAVAWLAIPAVTLGARFSQRGVYAGVGIAFVLVLAVTLGVDAHYTVHHDYAVIFPVALLGAVAMLSTALMRSDLHHRGAAVIDPLTGMLNRNALTARTAELAQQAVVARQPIGLIVGDLDRFKAINDAHGHTAGDAVLQEIAGRIRVSLNAFDLAYRVGGEEFLILLPGTSLTGAVRVAETLRADVAGTPAAGLFVTMSFGVTASLPGAFDYETCFSAADLALYEAKHAGRDCVRVRPVTPDGAPESESLGARVSEFPSERVPSGV